MNGENINKLIPRPRVLVAPLDWGLGHATRCIPIINVLKQHNIEVIIAAEGSIGKLLIEEFPSIVFLPLRGYKVKYGRKGSSFSLNIFIQIPRLFRVINSEKKWLNKMIKLHNIDAVISDNRFGLSTTKVPCVYVTHQLLIKTGTNLLNKIVQKINYRFINKFSECWVPDIEGKNNLAGALSHPHKLPAIPVKYLGMISRCKKVITGKKYELLILLSGPEPQRSIFENVLLEQLNNIKGIVVIIRGLPGNQNKLSFENRNIIVYDHLPAESLNELIQQSENIIARSGYSTVMDLVTLQQKAILVPTPGQTEQEYLARYLREKKLFYSCPQEDFSLIRAIEAAKKFNSIIPAEIKGINANIIIEWIEHLNKRITASR